MNSKQRRYLALGLLIAAVIGWPVSAVTIARNEPQVVLGLSWIAIILSAMDALFIVEEGQDKKDGG